MYARLFVGGTDGKEEDLGSARTWYFDDQGETVMLARLILSYVLHMWYSSWGVSILLRVI
jgi:hypothetical protein